MSAALPERGAAVEEPAVFAFLYKEARLLDERAFEDWLDLYAEDTLYWVPLRHGQEDHAAEMSIFRDDHALLNARLARLRHPDAHADTPAPRTVHMLANLEIVSTDDDAIEVAGALHMTEWREQRLTIYAARVRWTLERVGPDDFRIRRKRVDLVNSDGFHQYLTVPF